MKRRRDTHRDMLDALSLMSSSATSRRRRVATSKSNVALGQQLLSMKLSRGSKMQRSSGGAFPSS